MKILLVGDYATPTGGAELNMLGLRDGLRARGHDARVFSSSARPLDAESFADYECLGSLSGIRTLLQTANPSAVRNLRLVLNEFRPDVVHVGLFLTQLSPLILPLLKTVPSLYHVQWYRPACPLGTKLLPDGGLCRESSGVACLKNGCLPMRDWPFLMLQTALWRRWRTAFRAVVPISRAVEAFLRAENIETGPVIVPFVSPVAAAGTRSERPTVAFTGRFVPEKGIDVLIRAFALVVEEVPDARLLLVGDGPKRSEIKTLAETLHLSESVSWFGYLSRSDAERVLSEARMTVVPSRWAEPFGLVAVEAMTRGQPVVASNFGGLAEIVIDGDTGLLVPPNDPGKLAEAMIFLLKNPETALEMGKRGRERALAEFSENACLERWLKLYEEISKPR